MENPSFEKKNLIQGLASIPINLSLTALNKFLLHGLKIYLE